MKHKLIVAVLVFLLILPTVIAGKKIYLRSNEFVPDKHIEMDKEFGKIKQATTLMVRGKAAKRHIVIQLDHMPSEKEKRKLSKKGIKLLDYIPDNAWIASVEDDFSTNDVHGLTFIGTLSEEDKKEKWLDQEIKEECDECFINITVLFFEDVSKKEAKEIIGQYGEIIQQEPHNAWIISIPKNKIDNLLNNDYVQFVETAFKPLTVNNDGSRSVATVDTLQSSPYNLDGSGVVVAEWDEGWAEQTHDGLTGRVTRGDTGASDADHSTHVAGTMMGNGTGSSNNQYRGMATNASLRTYEWPNSNSELYSETNDSMDNNAILSQNSWSYLSCYEGDYYQMAVEMDRVARGIGVRKEFIVVFSAGNEGASGYNTTCAPGGTAKNTITVGNIYSDTKVISSTSSRGPTDDGRTKPDIVAAGDQGSGDFAITSTYTSNTYGTMQGTSMAAPAVSGTIALLHQHYKALYSNANPEPALVKAILLQTTEELGNTGPDYIYGWGLVNATKAVDFVSESTNKTLFFMDNLTSNGDSKNYTIKIPSGTSELKITLVWMDYPGTTSASKHLINDLDLVVYNSSGDRHYPWTLDKDNPSNAAVRTQRDTQNNVEQVYVSNPGQGDWTITINGTSIPQPDQEFALVVSENNPGILINFTGLTPSNNAARNINWTYINITSNPDLSEAWIDWNGTNESMSGSGTNFYINKTDLTEGIYYYTAYGNDTENNLGVSETRNVTIDLTPPYFYNAINWSQDFRIYSLVFGNITIADNFGIDYFIGFSNLSTSNWANTTVDASGTNLEIHGNDTINHPYNSFVCWYYWANDTAGNQNSSDLYCFNVANTPPKINSTEVKPQLPNSTNYLNCTYNATDADNQTLTAFFEWFKNGVPQGINNQILGAANTSVGEIWNCSANVSDSVNSSPNLTSPGVIIQSETPITFLLEPYVMSWNETAEIIRFETDRAVNVTLEYGETQSYGSSIKDTFSEKHELMITGINPNTLYYYKLTLTNATGYFSQNTTFNSTFKTSQDSKTSFSFAVLGDSRGSSCGQLGSAFTTLISDIESKGVDFVIMTGDDIQAESCSGDDIYWQGFHNVTQDLRKNTSLLSAIGNHEDPDRSAARAAWRNYWIHPLNGNGADTHWNETTFYWRYANSLFIFLNTEEPGNSGDIAGNQFTWFNETALELTGYTNKFVFSHKPLVGSTRSGTLPVSNPSRSAMIDNLMHDKNVSVAFYGHNHYYCYNTTHDGEMLHVVAGGGGAPLYSTSSCSGYGESQYHYVIVNVSYSNVTGAAYNISSQVIHNFYKVENTRPTAVNPTLVSTDSLNRTNATLQASWTFNDADGHTQQGNQTKWHNNSQEVPALANLVEVGPGNITKGQNWSFSVRVFDGYGWSAWVSSNNITIENTAPKLQQISDITINETQLVNITANADDNDNEALTYEINDTRFTQAGNSFTWTTNLTNSGTYSFRVNVTDGTAFDYQNLTVTVLDAPDFDDDGNPDFNDTDDDNDGINDASDTLKGSVSYITTDVAGLKLKVNGSETTNKVFTETLAVNITDSNNEPLVEFDWDFSNTLTVDWTVNSDPVGGTIRIIDLDLSSAGITKTVYVNKSSSSDNYVCIADDESTPVNVLGSSCSGYSRVSCGSSGQCIDLGNRFKVSSLSHSAVKSVYVSSDSGDDDDNDRSWGGSSTYSWSTTIPTSTKEKTVLLMDLEPEELYVVDVGLPNLALVKNKFSVNTNISKLKIKMEEIPENRTPLVNRETYQYFRISYVGMQPEDLKNAELEFRIDKNWLKVMGFSEELVALNIYDNGWRKLPTYRLMSTDDHVHFIANTDKFTYFAVTSTIAEVPMAQPVREINETALTAAAVVNETTQEIPYFIPVIKMTKKEFFGSISALVLLIAAGVTLLIVKKAQHPYPKLNRYIKQAINRGKTRAHIRNVLIGSGWPEEIVNREVDYAISKLDKTSSGTQRFYRFPWQRR